MRRRYWRLRGPSMKSIERKLVRMTKRNERIEQRKGAIMKNKQVTIRILFKSCALITVLSVMYLQVKLILEENHVMDY